MKETTKLGNEQFKLGEFAEAEKERKRYDKKIKSFTWNTNATRCNDLKLNEDKLKVIYSLMKT